MIYNILNKKQYIKEYFEICIKEWGNIENIENKVIIKEQNFINNKMDNIISVLILEKHNQLIGFISLFKSDSEEINLTPWYATMYVKPKYRNQGYSKILNKAIIKEAKKLKYKTIYLKTTLKNYYEKFNTIKIKTINNETIYKIEIGE